MNETNRRGGEERHDHHVTVHVVHVNETEKVSFDEPESATLQKVWDDAYLKLKIERKPNDIFQTGGKKPVSLMSHLGLTLKHAREKKIISDYHFGIVHETGGA